MGDSVKIELGVEGEAENKGVEFSKNVIPTTRRDMPKNSEDF